MATQSNDELLTVAQAAALLGVHYATAMRYVQTGRLKATQYGGKHSPWRVRRSRVLELMEENNGKNMQRV